MRRFVSTCLIVVILASQGLLSVHAHTGTTGGHAAAHGGQPHVHSPVAVHGHGHGHRSHSHGSHHPAADHDHGEEPELPIVSVESLPLHDADAFYGVDSVVSLLRRSRASEAACRVGMDVTAGVTEILIPAANSCSDMRRDSSHPGSTARIPLYLRIVSIRC